jgi:CheY-like chemotaxis protein
MRQRCKSILIVEDDQGTREALSDLFGHLDMKRAKFASDGLSALEAIRVVDKPCLVLLDLFLPDIHGSEVMGRMKSLIDCGEVFVVVVTASQQSSVPQGAIVMFKPYEVPTLIELVESYLGPI